MQRALKDGFTPEEVETAKTGWLQAQALERAQEGPLAALLNKNLKIDRPFTWEAQLEEKIKALTPQLIHEALQRHIHPDKMVYIKAGDFEGAAKKQTGTILQSVSPKKD
ncbi:MAG: hypothetical protein HC880_14270 [Bacteroidia bacterium]|nr:hypothetical protein [Bacteroidia bacterium]